MLPIGEFLSRVISRFTIKYKFIVLTLVLVLYFFTIIGYFGYTSYTELFTKRALSYSSDETETLVSRLNESVNSVNDIILQIIYDEYAYDTYLKTINNRRNDSVYNRDFREKLQLYLKSKVYTSPFIENISVYSQVSYFSYNKSYHVRPTELRLMSNFYHIVSKKKFESVWFINQENDTVDIYVSRILIDRNTGGQLGLLTIKIDKEKLFQIFSDYAKQKIQNVSIYSESNLELAKFTAFENSSPETLTYLLNKSCEPGTYKLKVKSDQQFFIYNKLNALNWKIITSISSSILLQDIKKIERLVFLICLITLPIWFILFSFLYKDILKPLNTLVKSMKRIEKGQFGEIVPFHKHDEFGYVFTTFNKMSYQINNLINKDLKSQIAMKDAEMKALQAQINPHFLYNTLESINWKAKLLGDEEISEMVSALSSIIDANVNRNNEINIRLQDELNYIQNYYTLIKKRFGNRINFSLNISSEVMVAFIPKLLIQPLIENSVYHGLERKKGGGTVILSIHKKEETLCINVTDNGIGIPADNLEILLEHLDDRNNIHLDALNNGHLSIGLVNVYRRLRLLYGEKANFKIESKEFEGTSISMVLPYISSIEEESCV